MQQKPKLAFWQIWNMSFGFLGIQFGFALQNANVSRIFQTLGASVDELPILWVAAPLTGLLVQPVIGYLSDNTWNRFGRRRPYFTIGAIFASLALIAMPNSPTLWIAAGMLWIMDASINISMEPFRAFVGDMLPEEQRTSGFAMQSFFIGVGAVVASALPYIFTNWLGVENTAPPGEIPLAVKWSFYLGAGAFFAAVMWTVMTTREYSPEQLAAWEAHKQGEASPETTQRANAAYYRDGALWVVFGIGLCAVVATQSLDKQLFILGGGLTLFGLLNVATALLQGLGRSSNPLVEVMSDMFGMPRVMVQLAVVQFFSWFALFAMWIYGTAAVTSHHYGATDVTSALYNEGADWVGVLFGAYNGFAALAAIAIPFLAGRFGCRVCHMINLTVGGLGLISFYFIQDPRFLLVSMVGIGIAWASILSMPYVLLTNTLPANKMGVYMGIFNFFIVIPQIVAASILGLIVRDFFDEKSIAGLIVGGVCMIIAGLLALMVDADAEPVA
ncbi:MAG: MFS transporter [Pseudomonadota bacterium]